MKISVIVPVYNVEKYLKKCIESILQQDFSDYELLLIDDGSTDQSGIICDKYAAKYSKIRVVHQKNQGLGGARNTGIEMAAGEYLLLLDSDDWIKQDTLFKLCRLAEEARADVVCFGMEFIDEQGKIIEIKKPFGNRNQTIQLNEFSALFSLDPYACNKMYRREVFINHAIRYPLRLWYEDLCTTPKILLCAKKIAFTDEVFYCYLQRKNSIMHIKNADRNKDMLYAVKSVLDFYKMQNSFEEYYSALCLMAVMHIMVLCTLRVAIIDPNHLLLKQFYDFTKDNFADFKTNPFVKRYLSKRHRVIFWLSKHKFYHALRLLDKLNQLRK